VKATYQDEQDRRATERRMVLATQSREDANYDLHLRQVEALERIAAMCEKFFKEWDDRG
jgi:hypothetical protein